MGEAKRRKQLDPNFGKVRQLEDKSPSEFYAIFHPINEEFLSKLEETEDERRIGWNKHPLEAIKFASEEEATNKAHELIKEKERGYELIICQVSKVGEQLKVEESGRLRKGNLLT
jgi:tRNA A22 N-methylase